MSQFLSLASTRMWTSERIALESTEEQDLCASFNEPVSRVLCR
jgi:hypothetical protein